MSASRSAIRDLARIVVSRRPLAWGQILVLWLGWVVFIGAAAYLVSWAGDERSRWAKEAEAQRGFNVDYMQVAASSSESKAAWYLVAEAALVACAAGATVFLVGRSLFATGGSSPGSNGVRRKCPFCAEDIAAEAKVCKHCGRDLPTAAPGKE